MTEANKESDARSSQSRAMTPYQSNNALVRGTSPLSLMRRLMGDMDRMFGAFGSSSLLPIVDEPFERAMWAPEIDVFERGQELVVRADLPGLSRENVKVNVNDDVLTVSGQRDHEQESERGSVHYSERSFGAFQRSIALPPGTDGAQIHASFENGVLEITAPLAERTSKQGREIPINPKASNDPKH
ncbi:MAG TPA: Hsp20/alpha crystallin family protein [Polyangiaceae bacterium]|nr:Hsp20/alpha crystallin family protein [Polyangiaceae bacterium]